MFNSLFDSNVVTILTRRAPSHPIWNVKLQSTTDSIHDSNIWFEFCIFDRISNLHPIYDPTILTQIAITRKNLLILT